MKRSHFLTSALRAVFLVAALPLAAAEPLTVRAKAVAWSDFTAIKGAFRAPLIEGGGAWSATLYRLPINQPMKSEASPLGTRIVVFRGAISVEVGGNIIGEYGPGAHLSIPSTAPYVVTATAAGECSFLLQRMPVAGQTDARRARTLAWAANPAVKGAQASALWDEAEAGQGAFHRVPINQPLLGEGKTDTRIFVLWGAISVEIAGQPAGEYGPGSFLAIPAGAKYSLTTTAAGECTFFLGQAPGTNPPKP